MIFFFGKQHLTNDKKPLKSEGGSDGNGLTWRPDSFSNIQVWLGNLYNLQNWCCNTKFLQEIAFYHLVSFYSTKLKLREHFLHLCRFWEKKKRDTAPLRKPVSFLAALWTPSSSPEPPIHLVSGKIVYVTWHLKRPGSPGDEDVWTREGGRDASAQKATEVQRRTNAIKTHW